MVGKSDFPVSMPALAAGARRKQAAMVELMGRLVKAESPSDLKAAVDACVRLAAEHARRLGGRVKVHSGARSGFGPSLEARFGPRKGGAGRVMVLGHLDTVWPVGALKWMPWRVSGGRIWGPGTLDMKAGVAMAFASIEMLMEADLLRREIVLLLNGDEEIGSGGSRALTEAIAKTCEAVCVMEPAQGLDLKTARKGIGNWRIEVAGVAAHAGVDFDKGANAIHELARKVETVSGWMDLKRGLTVSVGVAAGGTKSNVVPDRAWAEVDVRIPRRVDGERIARKFGALRPVDKRCTLKVTGGINRPPMERSRGTVRLFERARELARELGIELGEAATGGGSDGNFTAAMGIPTLDGMGAVGEGAHAKHEQVAIEHLAPRTALLAGMLMG